MEILKDSGARRTFESGAVRDIAEGKGRYDLLPHRSVAAYAYFIGSRELNDSHYSNNLYKQIFLAAYKNDFMHALYILTLALGYPDDERDIAIREVIHRAAKQFERGAKKYGERNWEKGIPEQVFWDSGLRHTCQYLAGITDEPHFDAAVWNFLAGYEMLCRRLELESSEGEKK